MKKRALVIGGGGPAGISWETGIIVGLSEAGVNVRDADLFLGTSGGSCVAAQMTSDLTLDELFQRQVDPALQAIELPAQPDFERMEADFARILKEARDANDVLQRVGALALATPTVTESERRAVILSRLTIRSWPQRPLAVVAVDTHSGERRVFERTSGVDLIDAVAASCAVPCIWPPVTIGDHRYMDSGAYSNENADLAAGFDRVLVFAPIVPGFSIETLATHVEQLQCNGATVEVVNADEVTKAALASVGGNVLDPAARALAAQAGREQGRRVAARVATFWR